jgi:geranylgeranyl pyrophosphate synthase
MSSDVDGILTKQDTVMKRNSGLKSIVENLEVKKAVAWDPREEYFLLMNRRSSDVHRKIADYLLKFNGFGESVEFEKLHARMMELPEARKRKGILGSTLTDLMFRLHGGRNDFDIVPALTIPELNNIYAYLDNSLLDDKGGVWERSDARENVSEITVGAALFRELIEITVLQLHIADADKIRILESLSECMARSYRGQQLDIEVGIGAIGMFEDDEAYLEWYENKSRLQSAFLYGFSAKLGAILADANDTDIDKAETVGQAIGLGLHISNDCGDFAIGDFPGSTGFKDYQDQMADLKNGRLSLPIFYVMRHGNEHTRAVFESMVGKSVLTHAELSEITQAVHVSGAYEFCKKRIRGYYNAAKRLIGGYPKSRERDMLSVMAGVIRTNKYLTALRQSK